MEQNKVIIPVAAIIPTMARATILVRTLNSLFSQDVVPQSIIIVDASPNEDTKNGIADLKLPQGVELIYVRAAVKGAAHQRTQGLSLTSLPFVFFMDDDILLEPHCIRRIFDGFSSGDKIGGVNAMITNQRYTLPGLPTRCMYIMLSGRKYPTWAGKVIGPAWNLLPEDHETLPLYVECEWLNTTCTMYRKEALPEPLFPELFKGYSIMEDLTLSLRIGRNWTLINAREGRIFHDSQPGVHKSNAMDVSQMEIVNRHYVMTKVLGRDRLKNYVQLLLFEAFMISSMLASRSQLRMLPQVILGKIKGYFKIIFS